VIKKANRLLLFNFLAELGARKTTGIKVKSLTDALPTLSTITVSVWGSAPSGAQYSMVTIVQGCWVARQYAASMLRYSHIQQGY
jgi:hypothetical protein